MESRYKLFLDSIKFSNYKTQFENFGNITVKIDNVEIKIYSEEMANVLLSTEFEFLNLETKQTETIKMQPYLYAYFDGFKNGISNFENKFKVSPDTLYSHNADAYVNNLLLKSNGNKANFINLDFFGWKAKSESTQQIITFENVKQFGFDAGMRYSFDLLFNEHPLIFEKFKNETSAKESPPKPFAGAKIIEIYDPIKVHNEFKKELKCDYNTFKAWFVDSIICDKQMSWNYDNGNKDQLRTFLFHLCFGWKPLETNTAFKIKVDSQNRETTKLNPILQQRLEKCTVK